MKNFEYKYLKFRYFGLLGILDLTERSEVLNYG